MEFIEVLEKLKKNKRKKIIEIFGKKFIVLPNVFDPSFFDSHLLANYLRNTRIKLKHVLDMGTGCGIQAIFVADKSEKILGIDISDYAIKNAKLNVKIHKLENKIKIKKSNLFSNINEKFDLILFNPPFFSKKLNSDLEQTITDYKYSSLKRFFKNVRNYLKKNGKIILVFSDEGNINYLNKIIKNCKFNFKIVDNKRYDSNNYYIYLIQ